MKEWVVVRYILFSLKEIEESEDQYRRNHIRLEDFDYDIAFIITWSLTVVE